MYHEGALAVAAFEARFMVSSSVSRQQIDKVNGLVTSLAFVQGSGECCHFLSCFLFWSLISSFETRPTMMFGISITLGVMFLFSALVIETKNKIFVYGFLL